MCAVFNDIIAKKIIVMCPEGKGSKEICSEGNACSKNKSLKKPCQSVNVLVVSFIIFL